MLVVVVVGVALALRLRTAARLHQEAFEQFEVMLQDGLGDADLARSAGDQFSEMRREYYKRVSRFDDADGMTKPRLRLDLDLLAMPSEAVFENDRRAMLALGSPPAGEADYATHVEAAWVAVDALLETGAFELIDDLAETDSGLYLPPEDASKYFGDESDVHSLLAYFRTLTSAAAGMQFDAGRRGDWDAFWAAYARGQCVERVASTSWPSILSSLVTMSCRNSRNYATFQLIAEHRLDEDVCRALLASADDAATANALRGIDGERLLALMLLTNPTPVMGTAQHVWMAFKSSPTEDVEAVNALFGRPRALITAERWTSAEKAKFAEFEPVSDFAIGFLLSIWAPVHHRYVVNARVNIGEQRALETAVALELHRLVTGAYPDTLADLVPEYLAAEPADPFTSESLRYSVTNDGESFVLYSIGLDGIDDGGQHGDDAVDMSEPALDYRYFPPPGNDVES